MIQKRVLQRDVISAITKLIEEGDLPVWASVFADASILVRSRDWSAFWEIKIGGYGYHGF